MNKKRIFGLILSLSGIIFLLVSVNGITGFAISDSMNITSQNITSIGLLFVIVGIILFELSFKKFR